MMTICLLYSSKEGHAKVRDAHSRAKSIQLTQCQFTILKVKKVILHV